MAPEPDLSERVADDVDAAFPALLAAHGGAVYSAALRLCRRRADAEDLAAETFVRAYAALRGYSPDRRRELRLRPWLVTIVMNLGRNELRDAGRAPSTVPLEGAEPVAAAAGDERLDDGPVGAAVAALPEAQRVPVLLRHVLGLSYADIGQVCGCPPGTAKSSVSRGLAALRRALTEGEDQR